MIEEDKIKVHSKTMLALNDELNDIVEKLSNGEYKCDADEVYHFSEIWGCYPSYGLYVEILNPLNYKTLLPDSEFSVIDGKRLWHDYEDIAHYAKSIKCKEMVAFAEKLLAFINNPIPSELEQLWVDNANPQEEAKLDKALDAEDID